MQNLIDQMAKKVDEDLAKVSSNETLAEFWQTYLSKNGQVTGLMKQLRNLSADERPKAGKVINEFKAKVQAQYDQAALRMKQLELPSAMLPKRWTLPCRPKCGPRVRCTPLLW